MNRIYFAIPIPYSTAGFWTRDSGLIVLALRQRGYDAWLVALGESSASPDGFPVLRVTLGELHDAAWWKSLKPDAIFLNTWSAPRYDGIRRAALEATPLVVERLDTDGIRSARLFPRQFIIRAWGSYRDKLPNLMRWTALPLALARFGIFYLFPELMDVRMVKTMERVAGLIAESPVAAERMQRMIEAYSSSRRPMKVIPHPVNEHLIHYRQIPKQNRIITVGRWASAQKDFPLVRKVLQAFLQSHPDWTATVVGNGVPESYVSRGTNGKEWEKRLIYHSFLDHEKLSFEYNRSKIYLLASRYESFCIAAAEALCCGCSVVGSPEVATSSYFAEMDSGTVSKVRTPASLATALAVEATYWNEGCRDPVAISSFWMERTGASQVSMATTDFLESLSPSRSDGSR